MALKRLLRGWRRNRGSGRVWAGRVFRCVGTQGRNNTRPKWAVGCEDMKGMTSRTGWIGNPGHQEAAQNSEF